MHSIFLVCPNAPSACETRGKEETSAFDCDDHNGVDDDDAVKFTASPKRFSYITSLSERSVCIDDASSGDTPRLRPWDIGWMFMRLRINVPSRSPPVERFDLQRRILECWILTLARASRFLLIQRTRVARYQTSALRRGVSIADAVFGFKLTLKNRITRDLLERRIRARILGRRGV